MTGLKINVVDQFDPFIFASILHKSEVLTQLNRKGRYRDHIAPSKNPSILVNPQRFVH
jgi:hypothetical protein